MRPAQQKQPMSSHEIPGYPFEVVSMDFCEAIYDGSKRNILVVVDHFSDYIEFVFMKGTASKDVINALKVMFARQGVPKKVVSDGAHNLSSLEMKQFAKEWSFELVNSSPYYPKGNGKAESAVKVLKTLIKKTQASGECLYEAVLEHRNTSNKIGYSPNERLLGRQIRGKLPILKRDLQTRPRKDTSRRIEKNRELMKKHYDRGAKKLMDLRVGDQVVVKLKPGDKRWTKGIVTQKLQHNKYELNINGKKFVRNRQLIALDHSKRKSQHPENSQFSDVTSSVPSNRRRFIDLEENFEGFPDNSSSGSSRNTRRQSLDSQTDFLGFPDRSENNNQAMEEFQSTRSRRQIRKPAYLKDYVINSFNC